MLGVSIDPAVDNPAVALWWGNLLVTAFRVVSTVPSKGVDSRSRAATRAIISCLHELGVEVLDWIAVEDQIIRAGGPRQSIVMLAQASAAIVAGLSIEFNCDSILRPLPETWKGFESKEGTEKRLLCVLSAEEVSRIECPALNVPMRKRKESEAKLASDVMDAIGIGLWALKSNIAEPAYQEGDRYTSRLRASGAGGSVKHIRRTRRGRVA